MMLMIPQITAGIVVRPHVKTLVIPSAKATMANALVLRRIRSSVVAEALGNAELQEWHT
jgi:hypothetical protein